MFHIDMKDLQAVHPVVLFVASGLIPIFTAAYTKRGSPIRYVALSLLIALAYMDPVLLRQWLGTTGWLARVSAGMMFWSCVVVVDQLMLRGWDYDHYAPNQSVNDEDLNKASDSRQDIATTRYPGSRMGFADEAVGRMRGVGTFWEAKNVPSFSRLQPDFVPSRNAFLLVNGMACLLGYYLHNAAANAIERIDPRLIDSEHIAFFGRLSEVTAEDLTVRLISTVAYWAVQYTMMQFFFSLAGSINAILFTDRIRLWRPWFGSFRDAYTLRNFWGKTWHQALRSSVESLSSYACHDILAIPREGLLQRYTKLFISFAISGGMHIAADMGAGLQMGRSGAMQFFAMQPLGILIEDCVQAVWSRWSGPTLAFQSAIIGRSVGYIWVVLWLCWTSPVWVYPVVANMAFEDSLLSMEAVRRLFTANAFVE